jgi:hypothetical protein
LVLQNKERSMKHYSSLLRHGLAALGALVALGGAIGVAHANPTIAVRKCSVYECNSAVSLKAEARFAYSHLPFGSIVFVSSEQYPLSAFVRICPGPRGGRDACLITAGDLGAVELDNQVYARAAKIQPIDIPADVAPTATQAEFEIVEEWYYGRILEFTLRSGISPWHNIFDPSTWHWMEFLDRRTGELHKVFTRDRVTLRFADGSTAQMEMQGVAGPSGHFFRFVFESIRLPNGEPFIAPPQPIAASPAPSTLELTTPWLNASFSGFLAFGYCAFLTGHCEFLSGGAIYDCYYRREEYPCG